MSVARSTANGHTATKSIQKIKSTENFQRASCIMSIKSMVTDSKKRAAPKKTVN